MAELSEGVGDAAEARVVEWARSLSEARTSGREHPDLVGGARHDASGLAFTRRVMDLLAGSDDAFATAFGLREASRDLPQTLPVRDRLAVRAGGVASLGLPWAVVPIARRWLRDRAKHLVLAARLPNDPEHPNRAAALATALERRTAAGLRPSVRLLGDPVHGPAAADREVERLTALAGFPGVTDLIVDAERVMPGGTDWSFEADVSDAVTRLRPLLGSALAHEVGVTLEPSSYRAARLVPEVMLRALADPALDRVRAGVGILTELPDSRELLERVLRWAGLRAAEGGAPLEVVLEHGGIVGAERIASIHSGLAVPALDERTEVDAQLLRLADLVLRPEHAAVVRVVIASDDPHLIAAVEAIAQERDLAGMLRFRLRAGVGDDLAEHLARSRAGVRIAQPLVRPAEFGGAVDLLLGLAAEAADETSALARLDGVLRGDTEALAAEGARLRAALEAASEPFPPVRRTQQRAREWDPSERDSALFYRAPDDPSPFQTGGLTAAVLGLGRADTGEVQLEAMGSPIAIPVVSQSGFAAEPVTDATVPANREWARKLLERAAEHRGNAAADTAAPETVAPETVAPGIEGILERARAAGDRWAVQNHTLRATRLRRAALATVAARDRLTETIAADTGAPIGVIDATVTDIVDVARYTGQLAENLNAVRGASFHPDGLGVVIAGASATFADQVESVVALLAAGSAVVWALPAAHHRAADVLIEEWAGSGLPADTVTTVALTPGDEQDPDGAVAFARALGVAETPVDRATVLASPGASRAIAQRRPELRLDSRFPATGSVIVTPAAEIDSAIADVVASAFGQPGPREVSRVILVGAVHRSRRFREGLADAVRGLRVGDSAAPGVNDPLGFQIGPLPAPPSAAGLRALTELDKGEDWLVEPRQLDETGRLWAPGVRLGVASGSRFWEDARDLPVLGLTHAFTLGDAIATQSAGGGAVAGLQSLDPREILHWLDRAQAAALAVNRPTTGARVERHPSGAWNDASAGISALSGGPQRLLTLGTWQVREGTRSSTLHLRGLDPEVQILIEVAQEALSYEQFDELRRAALADVLAWRTSLGVVRDTVGLGIERNALRHWPVPVQIRLSEGEPVAELLRVIAAALLVRAPFAVSSGHVLPEPVTAFLRTQGIALSLESDTDWLERVVVTPPAVDGTPVARVRMIGGDRVRTAEWMSGGADLALWAEPVTMAGPVELVSLLREQAISVRTHRHAMGAPSPELDEWMAEFER